MLPAVEKAGFITTLIDEVDDNMASLLQVVNHPSLPDESCAAVLPAVEKAGFITTSIDEVEDIMATLLQVDNHASLPHDSCAAVEKADFTTTSIEVDDIMAWLLQIDYSVPVRNDTTAAVATKKTDFVSPAYEADDIMASMLQLDIHVLVPNDSWVSVPEPEKAGRTTSSEEDNIMASLFQVDNHLPARLDSRIAVAADETRRNSPGTSEEDNIMASLLQVDNHVVVCNDSLRALGCIPAANNDLSANPMLFDPGTDYSGNRFYMFFRLVDQCFRDLFSWKDLVMATDSMGGTSTDPPPRKSNSDIKAETLPLRREKSDVSVASMRLDTSEIPSSRRRIFKPKEEKNAAAWAKRFEDPRSDLRDSMHRLRPNSNSQRMVRKTSKLRLSESC